MSRGDDAVRRKKLTVTLLIFLLAFVLSVAAIVAFEIYSHQTYRHSFYKSSDELVRASEE